MTPISQCLLVVLTATLLPQASGQPTGASGAANSSLDLRYSSLRPQGFIRLAGQGSLSIEVPVDWRVLSISELADLSRQQSKLGKPLEVEIAAAAHGTISGAIISVSVKRPQNWTQHALAKATASTLRSASEQMQGEVKGKPSQSGIGTVLSGPTYEVRTMQGSSSRVLVVSYREAEVSPKGRPLTWNTAHFHIPRASDEVEVTLAYRETDEVFWRPVMEHAIASLRY